MKFFVALPIHLCLACLGYAASAPIMAWAFAQTGSHCTVDQLLLTCRFVARPVFEPVTYGMLAGSTIVSLAFTHLTSRNKPWYLAIMFFGVLTLSALAWDSVMMRYVQNAEKLINDTINTLRFAVLASHVLFIAIVRHLRITLAATAFSVMASFAGVAAAGLLFAAVSDEIMGASRLLILFLLYALIGFGIHLMSIATLTARAQLRENSR